MPLGNFILLGRKIKDLSAIPADFQDGVDDLLCPPLIAVAECFIEQQRDADSLFLTFDKGDPGGQKQLETGAAGQFGQGEAHITGGLFGSKGRRVAVLNLEFIATMRDRCEQFPRPAQDRWQFFGLFLQLDVVCQETSDDRVTVSFTLFSQGGGRLHLVG